MFGLFEKEDIWDRSITWVYKDIYDITIKSRDELRARVFTERIYDTRRLIKGDNSLVIIRIKQVAKGLSIEALGLSGANFENWL
jgi:hypothetical protein